MALRFSQLRSSALVLLLVDSSVPAWGEHHTPKDCSRKIHWMDDGYFLWTSCCPGLQGTMGLCIFYPPVPFPFCPSLLVLSCSSCSSLSGIFSSSSRTCYIGNRWLCAVCLANTAWLRPNTPAWRGASLLQFSGEKFGHLLTFLGSISSAWGPWWSTKTVPLAQDCRMAAKLEQFLVFLLLFPFFVCQPPVTWKEEKKVEDYVRPRKLLSSCKDIFFMVLHR